MMGLVHRQGGRRYQLELLDPAVHPAAQGEKQVSVRCLSVLTEYIYARPQSLVRMEETQPVPPDAPGRFQCR